MKKNITTVLRLSLPLLGIACGFFTSTWVFAVIIWGISLAITVMNVLLALIGCQDDTYPPVALLNIANLFILGLALAPFAFLYIMYLFFAQGFKRLKKCIYRHQKELRCFLVLFTLNLTVWGTIFIRTQVENIWFSIAAFAVCIGIFGWLLCKSIKLFRLEQNRECYWVVNLLIFMFSLCAAGTAFIWPDLVSLDWGGLLLILWMFVSIIAFCLMGFLLWLVLTIINLR